VARPPERSNTAPVENEHSRLIIQAAQQAGVPVGVENKGLIVVASNCGQKLKQAEIAKMLGVSITPVREALRLLEAQGYVAVTAHRGAVVAPFIIEGAVELTSCDRFSRRVSPSKRRSV
jgi:hypothetical protein